MLTNLNPPVPNFGSPGGPVSLRNNQRMSHDQQVELANYGLAYQEAKKGVRSLKSTNKNFGLKRYGNDYTLYFPDNILDLEKDSGAQFASLVPEGTDTFNLLQPSQPFGKKLSMKDPKSIRKYLRSLVESV